MPLADLSAIAQRFADRADADADEAFNEQHDMARQERLAVESVEAAGRERWRRDQLARAAAAAAASGDDGARFGPLDDDEPETSTMSTVSPVTTPPAARAPRTPHRAVEPDDDEEAEQTWLR